MMDFNEEGRPNDTSHSLHVPGTVQLEQRTNSAEIILWPQPSNDPNDPLNWSKLRKFTNFFLACFYTLMTFVLLDIGTVIWEMLNAEFGVSYTLLRQSTALNFAGLAVGCWLVIPMAHKFGRRPVYIISACVQLVGAIWLAKLNSGWEILAANLVAGLGGAISETIVQMTISDLFFVHQRATINGIYLFMVYTGAYLGPVAAGYSAVSQGWRWIWWWCVIFLTVNLVAILFLFEETKYVVVIEGQPEQSSEAVAGVKEKGALKLATHRQLDEESAGAPSKKPWRERLALITPSRTPVWERYHQPLVVLLTFPAVAYTALMYGACLAWFAILLTTTAEFMVEEPWSFSASGVGLFSLSGFIGTLFGAVLGGPLNDKCIVLLSKRNGGVYEPEMRLWLNLIPIVLCPAGIFLYGIGLAHGIPWIGVAVGSALYTAGFNMVLDISLTYLVDCYHDIIGDALVAVSFIRNAISIGILFALQPWITATGLQNMFICAGCLCAGILALTIPMLIFGKRARMYTSEKYKKLAMNQPVGRRDF